MIPAGSEGPATGEVPLVAWLSVPCAIVPMLAFAWLVWWMDRYDREPIWLFALAFGWGAVGAMAIAVGFTEPVAQTLGGWFGVESIAGFSAAVAAPLVEEPAKAVILLLIVRSMHFDNTTDGFVYGAAVGLGFGMAENLLYFHKAAGLGDGLLFAAIVGVRTLYSAMMHAAASASIGATLGYCKFRERPTRWLILGGGWLAALGLHALWNGLLVAALRGNPALGLLDLVLFPGLFGLLFALFQLSLLDERRILLRELAEEADLGVVPREHLAFLAAYRRRKRPDWLPEDMDRQLYIKRATALGFRKHQLHVNTEPGYYADEITRLRREIVEQLNRAGVAPAWIPALGEQPVSDGSSDAGA
jgi:protease PrsW